MNGHEVWKVLEREFKGKSVDDDGNCLYRGPDGKKCVIGCFIPDDLYAKLEGIPLDNGIRWISAVLEHMPTNNVEVLRVFQTFHDRQLLETASVRSQRAALFNEYIRLCKEYNISYK